MIFSAKVMASCFGIGLIGRGGGTVAALVCCLLWYVMGWAEVDYRIILAGIVVVLVLGLWSATLVEKEWGEDSNRVVIDEWLGMSISLFLLPSGWKYVALSFVLFRFFDIVKPLLIRKAERLPTAWGVMADDVLAGIYSNLLLHIAIKTGL